MKTLEFCGDQSATCRLAIGIVQPRITDPGSVVPGSGSQPTSGQPGAPVGVVSGEGLKPPFGAPPASGENFGHLSNRPQPVFLRLPTEEDQAFWPWNRVRNKKLQRIISPCSSNDFKPPVRAYKLRALGAEGGVVLMEHLDWIKFLNQVVLKSGSPDAPIPVPEFFLPTELSIPASGEMCPCTSLKHTVMHELSREFSPYGRTEILIHRYVLPGSMVKHIAIDTASLLNYIRSQPPPKYTLTEKTLPPAPKRTGRDSQPGGPSNK